MFEQAGYILALRSGERTPPVVPIDIKEDFASGAPRWSMRPSMFNLLARRRTASGSSLSREAIFTPCRRKMARRGT